VEACVHNDWTGVHVLSVEVSKPEVGKQVLDFRFLRLTQYLLMPKSRIKFLFLGSLNLQSIFKSTYRVRRQTAAQRVRYSKDVQLVSQASNTNCTVQYSKVQYSVRVLPPLLIRQACRSAYTQSTVCTDLAGSQRWLGHLERRWQPRRASCTKVSFTH
jgi:hypothetical protein